MALQQRQFQEQAWERIRSGWRDQGWPEDQEHQQLQEHDSGSSDRTWVDTGTERPPPHREQPRQRYRFSSTYGLVFPVDIIRQRASAATRGNDEWSLGLQFRVCGYSTSFLGVEQAPLEVHNISQHGLIWKHNQNILNMGGLERAAMERYIVRANDQIIAVNGIRTRDGMFEQLQHESELLLVVESRHLQCVVMTYEEDL